MWYWYDMRLISAMNLSIHRPPDTVRLHAESAAPYPTVVESVTKAV